jgi:DNA adenine methylase
MDCNWIITYDNTAEVKEIYHDFQKKVIPVRYSVHKKLKASELLIHSPNVIIP